MRVVPRIVQRHVAERDIADRGIETPSLITGFFERFGSDCCPRIQRLSDSRGRWVQLDSGHRHPGRATPMNVPDPQQGDVVAKLVVEQPADQAAGIFSINVTLDQGPVKSRRPTSANPWLT